MTICSKKLSNNEVSTVDKDCLCVLCNITAAFYRVDSYQGGHVPKNYFNSFNAWVFIDNVRDS